MKGKGKAGNFKLLMNERENEGVLKIKPILYVVNVSDAVFEQVSDVYTLTILRIGDSVRIH
jgi:hypothetical protein